MPKVISVNISRKKGTRKVPAASLTLIENFGAKGDAHASSLWHRQVSLLAIESIEKVRAGGLAINEGDFAENITTEGIDLSSLPIGTRLEIGQVLLEVTQIGKKCHTKCEIQSAVGDCIMPKEGIFAKVLKGGEVKKGDPITVL
jgi:MOSC domain-containing protein YiiM